MKSDYGTHSNCTVPPREAYKAAPKSPTSLEDSSEGDWSLLRDVKGTTDTDEWEILDDDDNDSGVDTFHLVSLLQGISMEEHQQQPKAQTPGTNNASLAIVSLAELLRYALPVSHSLAKIVQHQHLHQLSQPSN